MNRVGSCGGFFQVDWPPAQASKDCCADTIDENRDEYDAAGNERKQIGIGLEHHQAVEDLLHEDCTEDGAGKYISSPPEQACSTKNCRGDRIEFIKLSKLGRNSS